MIQKRNRMIIFAVIAVIIVAAPISVYETLSPQPMPQISYSSHNLTFTDVGDCHNYTWFPFVYVQNLTAYSNISQKGGNVSSMKMVNWFSAQKLKGSSQLFVRLYVTVSGVFQSNLHPKMMLMNINMTQLRKSGMCIIQTRNSSMNTSVERWFLNCNYSSWAKNLHPTVNIRFTNDTAKANETFNFYVGQCFQFTECHYTTSLSRFLPTYIVTTATIEGLSENVMLSENISLEMASP